MAAAPDSLAGLVKRAGAAANAGDWKEAERLWAQVHALEPSHPQALYSLGIHAFQRGDNEGALEYLRKAQAFSARDPLVPLSIATVLRERGDAAGEWAAIHQALAIDAYFLPALLAKGACLERTARPRAAARIYSNALKIAPPEPYWPPVLAPQLRHAQQLVSQDQEQFASFLTDRLEGPRSAVESRHRGRWEEATAIMAGRTRPYLPDCNQLYVPRLPAIPFYDRALFPWIERLEARTDAIRRELHQVLAEESDELSPYIQYRPGDPVNQWQELNHSLRWSTYKLWDQGRPVDSHLERCPETAAALEEIGMVQLEGLCPNAMFSVLAPRTRIPPHHGETNARLVAHLPLVVPDGCRYRVGFEERQWNEGEVLVFDDSIEHEAYNGSDQRRVVLIFDVWNPLLSEGERNMVAAMMAAAREYYSRG